MNTICVWDVPLYLPLQLLKTDGIDQLQKALRISRLNYVIDKI